LATGLFLSLDGIDGTGKSTQCRLLAEWLRRRGRQVTLCADPGGTAVGELIRELLLDRRRQMGVACEALLFMASRAQLTAEVIRPALEAGQVVVSDRFTLANIVYQGHAGGLDPRQVAEAGRLATGGLEPDLTLVLDLPVELALARRGRPADRMEGRYDPAQVRDGFLVEARRRPERIRIVDAGPPVAIVHEQICGVVSPFLGDALPS
jgi:dTMP kinase